MSKSFIDKVRAIVIKNISDEDFGVRDLASTLGFSPSQTLRKVKAATGKSVNQYIRELRLEKAAKLIKKSDLSISEISYQVGFNSPSYFGKTFSKYYGITPFEYKTKNISLNELTANTTANKPKYFLIDKKIRIILALVLVCVLGYVLISKSMAKNTSPSNSIAVLPFKDLSQEDNQWFCDGVSDNILHSLSQMKEMNVTSFTSSSTYRDSNKQITEIAEELGVSYILEGSVTLHKGKVKIIAQLINANDEHVWSKEYNQNFEDALDIQNNVALEVINQMKISLNPKEEVVPNKYPTENMKAYSLFLKGQLFKQSGYYKDIIKSSEFNERAIELDSNFAEAYAQLAAHNFLIATEWSNTDESYHLKKAISRVNKALELDPNSVKANAVKAMMTLKLNRAESLMYFKKVFDLNPNDADSRYWYSFYFTSIENPNVKQALEQVEKAHLLNPLSKLTTIRYIWLLIKNERYEEAGSIIKKHKSLIGIDNEIHLRAHLKPNKHKGYQEVEPWLFERLEANPQNAATYYFWLANVYDYFYLDDQKALEYAKKSIEIAPDYVYQSVNMLTKNGFFEEAMQIMITDPFKDLVLKGGVNSKTNWMYYYYKKDYKQALKILDADSTSALGYSELSRTYAQMGNRIKLDSINKVFFIHGDNEYLDKALVHAILKERDSMYYYINKAKFTLGGNFIQINSFPEMDPYRNEASYKALLKEYHLLLPSE